MDMQYMLACILMSTGPAKHEQVAIFRRKFRGLRMFSSILGIDVRLICRATHNISIYNSITINPRKFKQLFYSVQKVFYFLRRKGAAHFVRQPLTQFRYYASSFFFFGINRNTVRITSTAIPIPHTMSTPFVNLSVNVASSLNTLPGIAPCIALEFAIV